MGIMKLTLILVIIYTLKHVNDVLEETLKTMKKIEPVIQEFQPIISKIDDVLEKVAPKLGGITSNLDIVLKNVASTSSFVTNPFTQASTYVDNISNNFDKRVDNFNGATQQFSDAIFIPPSSDKATLDFGEDQ